jgi:fluoroquinolone transport system permease protein
MSRLFNTLRLDALLQLRNKVYLIIAVAAFALAFALNGLFTSEQLHFFMPLVVLGGVSLTTVFLVGVLVLLERGEGTLDVVLVSPLRPSEYLASKLITLTALALVESAIIAAVAYGLGFSFGWLALAVVMRATMGVAVGVAVGVRYRSITHFLLPAIFVSLSFDLPNIWYLNLSASPLFYLWPSMPPLLLAKAAFMPVDPLQLVYAFSYGALAVGGALFWASRSIDRFVVRGELAS